MYWRGPVPRCRRSLRRSGVLLLRRWGTTVGDRHDAFRDRRCGVRGAGVDDDLAPGPGSSGRQRAAAMCAGGVGIARRSGGVPGAADRRVVGQRPGATHGTQCGAAVCFRSAEAPRVDPTLRLVHRPPGPDICPAAAASLTGLPLARARAMLRALEQVSLLDHDSGGRYRMHDLIHHFASDHAHHDLPETGREAALRRVVDFYLHTAHAGDRLLDPHRQPTQLDPQAPGCHPLPLSDQAAALTWFDTEHLCLLATQHAAATRGWHQVVWQTAWTLTTFHRLRGHLHDQLAVWQTGLAAADHLDGSPPCTTRRARRRSRRSSACSARSRPRWRSCRRTWRRRTWRTGLW